MVKAGVNHTFIKIYISSTHLELTL